MRAEYRGASPPIQLSGSDFRLVATRSIVSANVGEYALQFVQRAVADHQLPFAFLPVLDLHRRAQALSQALFQTGDVRINFSHCGWLLFAVQPLTHQCFGLAHSEAACDNMSRTFSLLFSGEAEQGTGM